MGTIFKQTNFRFALVLLGLGTFLVIFAHSNPFAGPPPTITPIEGPVQEINFPHVDWIPETLVVAISPGETRIIDVKVKSSGNLPSTLPQISAAIQPFLTISPATIPSFSGVSEQTVRMTFSIPAGSAFQDVDGTVSLRRLKLTVANSLPIDLRVWPTIESAELRVGFPPDLSTQTMIGPPVVEQIDSNVTLLQVPLLDGDSSLVNTFVFKVERTDGTRSLSEWFASEIDPSGILATEHSFESIAYSDGSQALVLSALIPEGYDGGPLAFAYLMSSDKLRVVSVTLSHEQFLDEIGYTDAAQIRPLMLSILETIELN